MAKGQGFNSMTPEQRSKIASMGGKAVQSQGVGHQWTAEEAAEAGRKGGLEAVRRGRARKGMKRQDSDSYADSDAAQRSRRPEQ